MPRNLRIFTTVTLKTQVQVESAPPVIESQAVSRSDDVCSFHRAMTICFVQSPTQICIRWPFIHAGSESTVANCDGACSDYVRAKGWGDSPFCRQVDELGERIVLSGQCRGIRGPSSSFEKAQPWFRALLWIARTQICVLVETRPTVNDLFTVIDPKRVTNRDSLCWSCTSVGDSPSQLCFAWGGPQADESLF